MLPIAPVVNRDKRAIYSARRIDDHHGMEDTMQLTVTKGELKVAVTKADIERRLEVNTFLADDNALSTDQRSTLHDWNRSSAVFERLTPTQKLLVALAIRKAGRGENG